MINKTNDISKLMNTKQRTWDIYDNDENAAYNENDENNANDEMIKQSND